MDGYIPHTLPVVIYPTNYPTIKARRDQPQPLPGPCRSPMPVDRRQHHPRHLAPPEQAALEAALPKNSRARGVIASTHRNAASGIKDALVVVEVLFSH